MAAWCVHRALRHTDLMGKNAGLGVGTGPLLGHYSQPVNATKDAQELGCYLHPEKNRPCPKEKQPQEMQGGKLRHGVPVWYADILDFSQGLSMGKSFYNLKHLL